MLRFLIDNTNRQMKIFIAVCAGIIIGAFVDAFVPNKSSGLLAATQRNARTLAKLCYETGALDAMRWINGTITQAQWDTIKSNHFLSIDQQTQ